MILVTMTDNGSGGQPVSMKNLKFLAEHARTHKKLLWVDACRVFENARKIAQNRTNLCERNA